MNAIFEPMERGFHGPINLLRSTPNPPSKCYVRFVNQSFTNVKVLWVNFEGQLQEYQTLSHGQFLDCGTYEDHAWVFRDCHNLDPMCVENKEVYFAKPVYEYVNNRPQPRRAIICIHRPLKTLCVLAARAVRDQLKRTLDPFFMEVPFNLQVMLVQMMMKKIKYLFPPEEMEIKAEVESCFIFQQLSVFEHNMESICHGICRHAEELSMLTAGGGELHTMIRESLFTMSNILQYKAPDRRRTMHMKEIGPLIWNQMLHLAVLDDFGQMTSHFSHTFLRPPKKPAVLGLRKKIEKRDDCMIPSHRTTLQRYHWEQLGKLRGLVRHDVRTDKLPYDIPEIKRIHHLREDERWLHWTDAMREEMQPTSETQQISREKIDLLVSRSRVLFGSLNIVESLFQVLCIFHKYVTGVDVPDIPGSTKESDRHSPAFYEPPAAVIKRLSRTGDDLVS